MWPAELQDEHDQQDIIPNRKDVLLGNVRAVIICQTQNEKFLFRACPGFLKGGVQYFLVPYFLGLVQYISLPRTTNLAYLGMN